MDAVQLHANDDPFAGTELSNDSDTILADIWDWCAIKGCRSICLAGRLFMRDGTWDKFKSRYIVLTGGCLVAFKMTGKRAFHLRKKSYPLFGSYVYSGLLARDELQEAVGQDIFDSQARVYQDGLQVSPGSITLIPELRWPRRHHLLRPTLCQTIHLGQTSYPTLGSRGQSQIYPAPIIKGPA